MLNIIVPMAGKGSRFVEAGYTFPKPLIAINGRPMIEIVVNNLKPRDIDHRFIFICQEQHTEKYDLYNLFKGMTDNKFELITIKNITGGAACTVLNAIDYINNDDALLIANSDQYTLADITQFLSFAKASKTDGCIMTLEAMHPKYSFVRLGADGMVMEAAEKKVISNKATVGIYYYKHGSDFVNAAVSMIERGARYNNEFYVCPTYNELILQDKKINTFTIEPSQMHGLGTPEELTIFMRRVETGEVVI